MKSNKEVTMEISCGTCKHLFIKFKGEGFTATGCKVDEDRCLTEKYTFRNHRKFLGLRYDYNLYELAFAFIPKDAAVQAPYMSDEDLSNLIYGEDCDHGSCDSCDMDCGPSAEEYHNDTPDDGDKTPGLIIGPLLTFEESQPIKDFIEEEERHMDLIETDKELFDFAPSEAYLNDIKDAEDEILEPVVNALKDLNEDVVLHPNHYAEANIPSGIECWDWYELAMTEEEVTGHFKGNALKYIFRAGRKADAIEDLEKARNYLARWIGYLKGDRTVHMRGKKNDG